MAVIELSFVFLGFNGARELRENVLYTTELASGYDSWLPAGWLPPTIMF
jgi:hypothetical protein